MDGMDVLHVSMIAHQHRPGAVIKLALQIAAMGVERYLMELLMVIVAAVQNPVRL